MSLGNLRVPCVYAVSLFALYAPQSRRVRRDYAEKSRTRVTIILKAELSGRAIISILTILQQAALPNTNA